MISRIEALLYRCLRYVDQPLLTFHVLVGPNASGKSTFLDVVAFMSDLVFSGPADAVSRRAPDVRDLVWLRQGNLFELAVDVVIPKSRKDRLKQANYANARYEIGVGLDSKTDELQILGETFWLAPAMAEGDDTAQQRSLFPEARSAPSTIIHPAGTRAPSGWRKVVNKVADSGNDYFSSETSGWHNLFRLGPQKSALANLPEDESKFPVATWFKELLMLGVQTIALHSERMRQPSAPGTPRAFLPDGSNLPWVVETLMKKHRAKRRSSSIPSP